MAFENLEFVNIDEEGNVWKLAMYQLASKTNRHQLSFFFNEKEFELGKFQSSRSAMDMWHLLCLLRKDKAGLQQLQKMILKTNC